VWEIKLFFGGIQVGEQIETFIQRSGSASGLSTLLSTTMGADQGKRLGVNEFGLRHRAFSRVDQQDNTVNHGQMRSTSPPKSA
jgi:hypothetical protein